MARYASFVLGGQRNDIRFFFSTILQQSLAPPVACGRLAWKFKLFFSRDMTSINSDQSVDVLEGRRDPVLEELQNTVQKLNKERKQKEFQVCHRFGIEQEE